MSNGVSHQRPSAASPARWGGRLLIILLLVGLLALSYLVLRNFLVPLLWAAILVYVTWPLNILLRRHLYKKRGLAAFLMTLILAVVIVLPLLSVVVSLRQEMGYALEALQEGIQGGAASLPPWLHDMPLLGSRAAELADRIAVNPQLVADWAAQRAGQWIGEAAGLFGIFARNALKFSFALIAAFFFYRDGEAFMSELRRGLRCLLGGHSKEYWNAAATMTRAVVYGLVLTALAQGILAGFGYWFAGLNAPVLLGALTALLALIPFGAPVVWVTVSVWLLWQGALWAGLGLLLWGALGVSSVDNLIRPLVISATANVSFLLVFVGVLGGLNAFGLVGLFLGPVVLAVLWAVWRQWLAQSETACMDNVTTTDESDHGK